MKKLDYILGGSFLGFVAIVYYMTSQLPEAARIYPNFVNTILLLLTFVHIAQTYKKKTDKESTAFKNIRWKQFFFVLISSGAYIFLIDIVGYLTSTILYILTVLFGLKVSKKVSIGISVIFSIAVYLLFSQALNVPLAKGLLI